MSHSNPQRRMSSIDREDADIAHAELQAEPERWRNYPEAQRMERAYDSYHAHDRETGPTEVPEEPREEIEEAEEEEELPRARGKREMSSVSTNPDFEAIQTGGTRYRTNRLDSVGTTLSTTSTRMERAFMDYLDRHPTAIKRMEEHRLQHSHTVGTTKSRDGVPLPSFGGGKPYPPPLPEREEYVVEFDGHEDPRHAQNWPLKTKLIIAGILILDALAATFASSVFSPAMTYIEEHFRVGREVATLGTSLFVLGYAVGPIIFAPMSELYGRRVPVIIAAFGFGIFNITVAVAKDYQTLMLGRFFAGLFGSSPLTVVAAVFADMFSNEARGVAVACFSATIICGPFTGPFIGGFIAKSYLGWRWTAYIPAFMGFAACILAVFFQKESYGPVILVDKASELRRMTRNWGIHAKQEEVEVDLKELLSKNISRPLRILFTEPIVLLVTIYMSFIYGLLYLNLTAYGLVFGQVHGFSNGVNGLPYIGLIIGVMIGFVCVVLMNPGYVKKLKANNNIPVPEWRLPLTMVGGIIFCAGLFWFGWAGYMKSTPWIVPTLAGLFLGFGIYAVFLQCLNYIIDAYLMFAASAIAANTFMRSIFGAVFPLFGYYMFEGIGINWGMSLLGFVAAAFIPMPFIFYIYGKKLRSMSKFAPALDIQQDKRRDEEARMGGDASANTAANDAGEESEGTSGLKPSRSSSAENAEKEKEHKVE
ncbi:hypothetical protein BAUCODRAFT_568109 [Baudoinia panamericana UAMH 10762]|uniref:Cercosporin MFS transporter CTB4 n=1 Tax=Baudoinia panamericana (strain UAMH 10762) TaxID=717646 RepID=M2N3F2_BAUPA|nr:uncharacterized protein BAUCODRAFT_568109 [Baudoinia panamericana UAMH 10762]EMC93255.1 hypothetical protein BAUCODRAFT_568109 [Baudoinia panamericana UAMH 10762]